MMLSGGFSQSAFGHGIIDQNNLGEPLDGSVPLPPPVPTKFGQVFTPTVPRLDAVEIEIVAPSLEGIQPITVNVHQGNTFGVPTSQLGTAILPPLGQCNESCVIHIDLPAPIPLLPNQPHILEIIPDNAGISWILASSNNPYLGGSIIIDSDLEVDFDLIFATLFLQPGKGVLVGGTIIPVDTTALLLASTQITAVWLIPVIVAGIGITIVITRKF